MLSFKKFLREGVLRSGLGALDALERNTRNWEPPVEPVGNYVKKYIQKGGPFDKPLFKGVMGDTKEKPLSPEQEKQKAALPTVDPTKLINPESGKKSSTRAEPKYKKQP